jgi:uncharacterized protein with HEPN domain
VKRELTKKFLLHFALESIENIESFIEGLSFSTFVQKSMHRDATIQRLQFLGFGLRDLSKRIRTPDTKAYLARKARRYDNLTKDYRKIDDKKIWDTVMLDLPRLKKKLESLAGPK